MINPAHLEGPSFASAGESNGPPGTGHRLLGYLLGRLIARPEHPIEVVSVLQVVVNPLPQWTEVFDQGLRDPDTAGQFPI